MLPEDEREKQKALSEEREEAKLNFIDVLSENLLINENGDDQVGKNLHADLDRDVRLTDTQKQMIREIRERFEPEENVTDLCILYEVTGYQDESAEVGFWESYKDFFELGDEDQDDSEDGTINQMLNRLRLATHTRMRNRQSSLETQRITTVDADDNGLV